MVAAAILALATGPGLHDTAMAEDRRAQFRFVQQRSWTEEKCVRYARDWREALHRRGPDGLSPAFRERHAAFLAGGCRGPRDVCPLTAKDFELANILTIRAMNFGAASTFLPFSCSGQIP
jgi:hypothetical protein